MNFEEKFEYLDKSLKRRKVKHSEGILHIKNLFHQADEYIELTEKQMILIKEDNKFANLEYFLYGIFTYQIISGIVYMFTQLI